MIIKIIFMIILNTAENESRKMEAVEAIPQSMQK